MKMYLLDCVLGLLPLLVWWLLRNWNELWYVTTVKARCTSSNTNTKVPPGHLGFPIIGEMLTFLWYFKILHRPDDFINDKRRKYGDNVGAYRTFLFGSPSIVVCSPSLCKYVLNSTDDEFKHTWSPEVMGHNSVVILEGTRHDRVKSFLMTVITRPDALNRIALQVQPGVVDALRTWCKKGRIKTFDEVKKVTFETMGRYFAGFEPGTKLDALEKLNEGVTKGFRAQRWNFPGTAYRHAVECRKKITKMLREELEQRKQNQKMGIVKSTIDLIDSLMQFKDEKGQYLRDEEVVDNVASSINAGALSVAHAMAWSVYFLATNPHVLHKLQEENKEMSSKKEGKYITCEDISKLRYTNKVVEETIRMGNLSAFVPRKAVNDIKFKGYLIPKDWNVMVWLRYLHTDPQNFDNPMCFNPDRWDVRPRHGTYLPFSGGSRTCPGNALVRIHLAIFLHHLSKDYKWKMINPDAGIRYLPLPTPADGLEISITNL